MSNKKCCVPGCLSVSGLHKFPNPHKEKDLFNTWVYAVGGGILRLENDRIFKYRRVCHKHFEPKYWNRNNRIRNIAIPTQNMSGLSSSKFTSEEIFRPIQNIMEASSSKGNGAVEDVQMKENFGMLRLDAVEDVQMKGNFEPVNVTSLMRSVPGQIYSECAVDVSMKESFGVSSSAGIVVQLEHNYCFPREYVNTGSVAQENSSEIKTNEETTELDVPLDRETGIDGNEETTELDVPSDRETGTDGNEGHEFSWQNDVSVVCDEGLEIEESKYFENEDDISMFNEERADRSANVNASHQSVPDGVEAISTTHEWYKCNVCSGNITGFRYTCVQCADFDLCAACESRGAHAAHYVLRVPGPRPPSEIQSVLTTIRRVLLNDSVIQLVPTSADDVLHDVKEEQEDPICEELAPEGEIAASFDTLDSDYQENSDSSDDSDDSKREVRLHRKKKCLFHTTSPRHKRKRVISETTPSDEDTRIHSYQLREDHMTSNRLESEGSHNFGKKEQWKVFRTVNTKGESSNSTDVCSPTQPVDKRDGVQTGTSHAQLLMRGAYVPLQRLSKFDIDAAVHSNVIYK